MSSTPDLLALAAIHRAAVAAGEEAAVVEIIAAYQRLYTTLETELDDLLAFVARRREAGQVITVGWMRRQARLGSLIELVEAEVTRITGQANTLIQNGQRTLATLGTIHAEQLILAGLGTAPAGVSLSLSRLPTGAIEQMVGMLAPDTPLRDALDRLPGMAGQDVGDALVRGVATGQNPRVTARLTREALGGNLASAERTARTAQLTAYRESVRSTFAENRSVVTGWRWVAHFDSRTCLSCISRHGQEFPLEEPMRDHWSGRCSSVAVTRSFAELGFPDVPDTRPQIEMGEAWFLRQPDAIQRQMMGRSKFHAYKAGEFSFSDLSVAREDPIFGVMYQEASLKSLVGAERAREWYARAAEMERADLVGAAS